ncbi:MAG: MFS transporter [Chloroflexi bacterium]|nr:MFS transporter [Chloroflexota bacterium]
MTGATGEHRALMTQRGLYYTARFFGQSGQNLMLAALIVVAGKSSDSAVGLSSVLVATVLPGVIFGLLGGAVADRLGPPRAYAVGAVLRLLPPLVGAFFIGGPTWAWMVAAVYATGSQVFAPAEMAMVRVLQSNHAGRGHAALVALQYSGNGLGAVVLAPALYFLGGPAAMMAGAVANLALVVVFSIALALALRGSPAAPKPAQHAFSFAETCRFFQREHLARYAIAAFSFKVLVVKTAVVVVPLYLSQDLRLGAGGIALLAVPGIAGVLLGLGWAARSLTMAVAGQTMRLSLVGMGVAGLALAGLDLGVTEAVEVSRLTGLAPGHGITPTVLVAVVAAFIFGLSVAGSLLGARVALTETAPSGQQARVFAVKFTLTEAVIALPLMAAGFGTDVGGPRLTLAVVGALALTTVALLELPRLRERLALGAPVPEPLAP